jgi:hypothetical protein
VNGYLNLESMVSKNSEREREREREREERAAFTSNFVHSSHHIKITQYTDNRPNYGFYKAPVFRAAI